MIKQLKYYRNINHNVYNGNGLANVNRPQLCQIWENGSSFKYTNMKKNNNKKGHYIFKDHVIRNGKLIRAKKAKALKIWIDDDKE